MRLEALAIVNPAAGSGRCATTAPPVLESIRASGIRLEVALTTNSISAAQLAADGFRRGYRRFFAAGGDGTLSEVLNGLMPVSIDSRERVTLGVLPLGSGNSFIRQYSAAADCEATLKAIPGDRRVPSDVVRLEHRSGTFYSLNLVTLGFPVLVARSAIRFKRFGGGFAYFLAVLTALRHLRPIELAMAIDNRNSSRRRYSMVAICNSKYTAGAMLIAPRADTRDGRFDLIRAAEISRTKLLRIFPRIYRGTHLSSSVVNSSQCSELRFASQDPIDLMIDGELVQVEPRRCDVLHQAIDILIEPDQDRH